MRQADYIVTNDKDFSKQSIFNHKSIVTWQNFASAMCRLNCKSN
jgi:hypothetical protein